MVCLPDQLPLLRFGNHQVISYDTDWLVEEITKAAAKAGHEDWFFAKDITRAVAKYLRDRHQRNSITVEELYLKIEHVLEYLGCGDIAKSLEIGPPPALISLKEISREVAVGETKGFMVLLGERISETESTLSKRYVFEDVRCATKRVCGVTRWTPECEAFAEEIVLFVNEEVRQHCHGGDVEVFIK